MARAEEMILQGTDLKKFNDGGHLIGDQLVAGDNTDSFQFWNVAPQIAPFNTPAYAGIENEVRDQVEKNNQPMHMRVTLGYLPDYTVTIQNLIDRGILPRNHLYPEKGAIITIPRRIPSARNVTAKVQDDPSVSPPKPAPTFGEWDEKGPTLSEDPSTLGKPFTMKVRSAANAKMVEVEATQWTPSPDPADPDPWIGLLRVDAEQQRKGYGRELARRVEERFRLSGRDGVRLAVLDNNPCGLAFWTALGYEVIDRRADLRMGRPCSVLRKALSGS